MCDLMLKGALTDSPAYPGSKKRDPLPVQRLLSGRL
jgi:hypothetical protein